MPEFLLSIITFRSQSMSFQIFIYFYESFLETSEHGGSKAFQLKSKNMSDKKIPLLIWMQLWTTFSNNLYVGNKADKKVKEHKKSSIKAFEFWSLCRTAWTLLFFMQCAIRLWENSRYAISFVLPKAKQSDANICISVRTLNLQ